MSGSVTRRGFLGIGMGALAVGTTVALTRRRTPVPARGLVAMAHDPEAMATFGEASRRVVGSNGTRLARDLAPAGRDERWVDRAAPDEIRMRVTQLISDDVDAGRTVEVAGWIVTPTEAKVAALVHLAR